MRSPPPLPARSRLLRLVLPGLLAVGCHDAPPAAEGVSDPPPGAVVAGRASAQDRDDPGPALAGEPEPHAAGPSAAAGTGTTRPDGPTVTRLDDALRPAMDLVAAGRFDEAYALADTYARRPDALPYQAAFMRGYARHKAQRYAAAVEHFERAVALAPDYHPTWHFLGFAAHALGDLSRAEQAFGEHAARVPGEGDDAFGLALVALERHELDEAERQLTRARQLHGQQAARGVDRRRELAKVEARLGDVHAGRGDWGAARDALGRAVRHFSGHDEIWHKLALAHQRLGEDDLAAQAFAARDQVRAARADGERPADASMASGPAAAAPTASVPADDAAIDTPPAATPSGGAPPARHHASSRGGDTSAFPFSEVAAASGLRMHLTSGRTPATQIVEVKGGGVGLLDREGDGDWDVFVPNGATLDAPDQGPGARLFENIGAQPGELAFRDVTGDAGIRFRRWGTGVAVGDVDGDGSDDLYITAHGANALLVNDGSGRFVDRSVQAGVDDRRWGTGCAFGDLDGDGDLDLYVVNYLAFDVAAPPPGTRFRGVPVFGGPAGLPAQADVLYANRGDGRFEDVSALSGVLDVEPAHGLNAVVLDLDLDGALEILVGNDSMANRLFDDAPGDAVADSGGGGSWTRRLADRALLAGLSANGEGHHQATMGVAVGDVDGDGWPDLFSSNFSSDTNTLHVNRGGLVFDDRTARYGLGAPSRTRVGWATGFHDLDLDGDEDLTVFNGHVYSQARWDTMDSPARQAPLLLARDGRRFVPVEEPVDSPWTAAHVDRSAAFGDLDRDGDVDLIVGERDGPLRLLRNDARVPPDAWLRVRLRDARPGRHATRGLGSRVSLHGAGPVQHRWILSGGSYLSASAPEAHFGLPAGARDGPLRLVVRWPDGAEQSVEDVTPGAHVVRRTDAAGSSVRREGGSGALHDADH